jgi:AmmeMemoRadiSam system protein A
VLTEAEQRQALEYARRAATHPLSDGADGFTRRDHRWLPGLHSLFGALREPGACFVTLRTDGHLQGCIGSLVAHRPLGVDVAANAAAAAFDDPRLPPLTLLDVAMTEVHVSVLGQKRPMPATDLDALRSGLRSGVDGLVVEAAGRRATFLPSVWDQVADADDFLAALWRKAGLPPGSWPDGITVQTYRVQEFAGPLAAG